MSSKTYLEILKKEMEKIEKTIRKNTNIILEEKLLVIYDYVQANIKCLENAKSLDLSELKKKVNILDYKIGKFEEWWEEINKLIKF